MYASILLVLPLLGVAFSQGDGIGGCDGGSITADRCCNGDVITSDGAGIDTSDISNLVCCVGGSRSGFSFGGTSCAADQTSVPFSQLSNVAGASSQRTTVVVSNDITMMQGTTVSGTTETSTPSSSTAEEPSDAMTSSGMTGTESQGAVKSATDTSTGAAASMTSGPMAGALVMAGGFMMAAL